MLPCVDGRYVLRVCSESTVCFQWNDSSYFEMFLFLRCGLSEFFKFAGSCCR
jgi:hypothetical protein